MSPLAYLLTKPRHESTTSLVLSLVRGGFVSFGPRDSRASKAWGSGSGAWRSLWLKLGFSKAMPKVCSGFWDYAVRPVQFCLAKYMQCIFHRNFLNRLTINRKLLNENP